MILSAPRQVLFTYLSNTKILSLVLTCFLYSATTNANCIEEFPHTTEITDLVFEQALIDLGIDSNGLNGNILTEDARFIETLLIGHLSISDLRGIEAFVDLKFIDASNNNILAADFSQNLDLEFINLENNKMSSLNVSSNSALIEIIVNNNQLTSIELGDNLLLEYLSCSLNAIDTLNISANINLKVIRCYSNNLSSINLNANTALEMLFIDDNNLDTIDLSMNTGLDTLTCDNNNLNILNLATNTNLEYLGCSNNNLSELDLTTNTSLTRILCNNNSLGEVDVSGIPDLFLLFAMNNQIQSIDLTNNPALRLFRAENNLLNKVDIRNDNNDNIIQFVTTENPSLTCIFVDDSSASFLGSWELDEASSFVEDNSDCETLSITEDLFADFMLYPNPANGLVNINLNAPEASLKLYSIKGQLLINTQLAQGINSVNISNFSSGLYVVTIQDEANITTKKLVIN